MLGYASHGVWHLSVAPAILQNTPLPSSKPLLFSPAFPEPPPPKCIPGESYHLKKDLIVLFVIDVIADQNG